MLLLLLLLIFEFLSIKTFLLLLLYFYYEFLRCSLWDLRNYGICSLRFFVKFIKFWTWCFNLIFSSNKWRFCYSRKILRYTNFVISVLERLFIWLLLTILPEFELLLLLLFWWEWLIRLIKFEVGLTVIEFVIGIIGTFDFGNDEFNLGW